MGSGGAHCSQQPVPGGQDGPLLRLLHPPVPPATMGLLRPDDPPPLSTEPPPPGGLPGWALCPRHRDNSLVVCFHAHVTHLEDLGVRVTVMAGLWAILVSVPSAGLSAWPRTEAWAGRLGGGSCESGGRRWMEVPVRHTGSQTTWDAGLMPGGSDAPRNQGSWPPFPQAHVLT